jgi:hypothetical protein
MFVIDDIAAADASRPFAIPWSVGSNRGSLQIMRTADAAFQREGGGGAGYVSWGGQFIRQAWPLTLREQGPLVNAGINAITITASGEVPRSPRRDALERLSVDRMETFGRVAMSSALALAGGGERQGAPRRYLVGARKLMPGWTVALLALGLILPALVTSIDAFARARRSGAQIGAWLRWVLSAAVPFAVLFAGCWIFQLVGWLPRSPVEAISPVSSSAFETAPALISLALLFALAWLVLRPALWGHDRNSLTTAAGTTAAGTTAAVALAVVLSVEVLLVWAANPFTALLLAPALHLCLLAALPQSPSSLLLIGGMAAALLLPIVAVIYYGLRFDLGLDVGSYLLLLVTAATSSLATAVLCSLVAGSLVTSAAIAIRLGRVDALSMRPTPEDTDI